MSKINIQQRTLYRNVLIATCLFFVSSCNATSDYSNLSNKSVSLSRSFPYKKLANDNETPSKQVCKIPNNFELDENFDVRRHVFISSSNGTLVKTFQNDAREGDPGYLIDREMYWRDSKIDLAKHISRPGFGWSFRYIMDGYLHYAKKWSNNKHRPCPLNLLFYFNGGLNSQEFVESEAAKQIPLMLRDGYYPIFFIWDTEPFESYFEQIRFIHDGWHRDNDIRAAKAPFVMAGDIITGYARAPSDWLTHTGRYWNSTRFLADPCRQLIGDVRCGDEESKLSNIVRLTNKIEDKNYHDGMGPIISAIDVDEEKKISINQYLGTSDEYNKVNGDGRDVSAGDVLYSALTLPRLAIGTPLARGFGKTAWDNFVRRTRVTIRRPVDVRLGDAACPENHKEHLRKNVAGSGAFSRFFTRLDLLTDYDPERIRSLGDTKWACYGYRDEEGRIISGDFQWIYKFDNIEKYFVDHNFDLQRIHESCDKLPKEEWYKCACGNVVNYHREYQGYDLDQFDISEVKSDYEKAVEIIDKLFDPKQNSVYEDMNLVKGYCHDWNNDYLFSEFYRDLNEFFKNVRPNITLIGHSMGGIVINELVSRFPKIPYSDIVVMASAASSQDTIDMLEAFFEEDNVRYSQMDENLYAEKSGVVSISTQAEGENVINQRRFYSLMLHPLNDDRELTFWGLPPSGSLLRWIDEFYEIPKTPLGRVFGYWPNALSASLALSDDARKHTFFRVYKQPETPLSLEYGLNPVEHGMFNDTEACFWRPTFWGVDPRSDRYKHLNQETILDHGTCPCGVGGPDEEASSEELSYKHKLRETKNGRENVKCDFIKSQANELSGHAMR